jgi:hypothetical protein
LKLFLPLNASLQAAALLQKVLRGLLIGPEVRRGRLRFDPIQLGTLGRDIKETSRAVRPVCSNPRKSFLNPELKLSQS